MDQISLKIRQISQTIYSFAKRHRVWLTIVASVCLIGGFWFKVNGLINIERDEATYQASLDDSSVPVLNQATLDKIKQLRDSGAKNPGTNYDRNRTNPFAE